ncbi:MAG TPA: reactive intermediate/imine deaminase [Planctomycetes bacterium]|nr:reactive intermediate/imine deaminase [Planctomycetota bacterium]
MREIATDKAPKAIGPYSQAIDAGALVFLSGQIALDPATGQLRSGGIRAQAAQVLANIDAVLAGAGLARRNVVKTTVFLADMADFAALNEAYAEFFGDVRPARSTVQAAALPRGALVEIEAVASRA